MNDKLQRERSNNVESIKDEREELLLSYKVVEGKCWQQKSSEGLNMRSMNTSIIPISDLRTNHLEKRGKSYDSTKG